MFLVLLYLVAEPLSRHRLLRATLFGTEWFAIYVGLRLLRGLQHYDYWQAARNWAELGLLPPNYDPDDRAYAYFVVVLFGPMILILALKRRDAPRFLRRALLVVPCFIAVAFIFSSIIESRISLRCIHSGPREAPVAEISRVPPLVPDRSSVRKARRRSRPRETGPNWDCCRQITIRTTARMPTSSSCFWTDDLSGLQEEGRAEISATGASRGPVLHRCSLYFFEYHRISDLHSVVSTRGPGHDVLFLLESTTFRETGGLMLRIVWLSVALAVVQAAPPRPIPAIESDIKALLTADQKRDASASSRSGSTRENRAHGHGKKRAIATLSCVVGRMCVHVRDRQSRLRREAAGRPR